MSEKHGNTGTLILAGGGLALAYLFFKNHNASPTATVSILKPGPVSSDGSGALIDTSVTTTALPSITTTTTGLTAPMPLTGPAIDLGVQNGVDVIQQQSAVTPYGTVTPSNFITRPNPLTGAEAPTKIVDTGDNTTTLIQPPANLCPDGIIPNNNPLNMVGSSAGILDGLVKLLSWIASNRDSGGWVALSSICSQVTPPSGMNAAQYASNVSRISGIAPSGTVALWQVSMTSRLVRGLIGAYYGDSYTFAIPDECVLKAFNIVFGSNYTSINQT